MFEIVSNIYFCKNVKIVIYLKVYYFINKTYIVAISSIEDIKYCMNFSTPNFVRSIICHKLFRS